MSAVDGHAGLDEWAANENETMNRLGLRLTPSKELSGGSEALLNWVGQEGIKQLAVHLDVDAISPSRFRPVLFN